MAVATTGPMPGICRIRVQPASAAEIRSSFIVELFDLLLNKLPLIPQHVDQVAHLRCQVRFCVLQNVRHRGLELRWFLRKDHTAFKRKRTQLVDHRRSARDQTVANTMDRLQVQLVICLDRDKAHVLAFDSFSNSLRVDKVVLVRLDEGLHELSRDQSDIMALLPQRSAKEVSAGAGLQSDQRGLHASR